MNRTPLACALFLTLSLVGCGDAETVTASDPPAPTAEQTNPTNTPEPETSPERESETPEETETPEDPQNVEDLPDIWPELSAMWARQPSDARTNHCRNFAEDATSELTVRMWKLLYAEETGEEADADDVAIVLRRLCSDVSID